MAKFKCPACRTTVRRDLRTSVITPKGNIRSFCITKGHIVFLKRQK